MKKNGCNRNTNNLLGFSSEDICLMRRLHGLDKSKKYLNESDNSSDEENFRDPDEKYYALEPKSIANDRIQKAHANICKLGGNHFQEAQTEQICDIIKGDDNILLPQESDGIQSKDTEHGTCLDDSNPKYVANNIFSIFLKNNFQQLECEKNDDFILPTSAEDPAKLEAVKDNIPKLGNENSKPQRKHKIITVQLNKKQPKKKTSPKVNNKNHKFDATIDLDFIPKTHLTHNKELFKDVIVKKLQQKQNRQMRAIERNIQENFIAVEKMKKEKFNCDCGDIARQLYVMEYELMRVIPYFPDKLFFRKVPEAIVPNGRYKRSLNYVYLENATKRKRIKIGKKLLPFPREECQKLRQITLSICLDNFFEDVLISPDEEDTENQEKSNENAVKDEIKLVTNLDKILTNVDHIEPIMNGNTDNYLKIRNQFILTVKVVCFFFIGFKMSERLLELLQFFCKVAFCYFPMAVLGSAFLRRIFRKR